MQRRLKPRRDCLGCCSFSRWCHKEKHSFLSMLYRSIFKYNFPIIHILCAVRCFILVWSSCNKYISVQRSKLKKENKHKRKVIIVCSLDDATMLHFSRIAPLNSSSSVFLDHSSSPACFYRHVKLSSLFLIGPVIIAEKLITDPEPEIKSTAVAQSQPDVLVFLAASVTSSCCSMFMMETRSKVHSAVISGLIPLFAFFDQDQHFCHE